MSEHDGPQRRQGYRRPPAESAEGLEDPPGEPEWAARELCLELLGRRARSRAELANALSRRGVPAEVADWVLSRFTEVGLINDRAFAETLVSSRHASQGLARGALAEQLRHRGVDPATVSAALAGLDEATEMSTARSLVRRRLSASSGLPLAVRLRRLVGVLARKGYPAGLAYRVVREEFATAGIEIPAELAEDADPDLEAQ